MPRKPRIHYPGAVYHVMLRGNGGQDIFFDTADRSKFLLILQQGMQRYHHRVHSYCLMTNHVHLALQVMDIPLSKIMQNLSFRYTQYINRKKKQTGHLFQGRFKALLIDKDNYLLELIRYIHLNPIRAGMVIDLNDYLWSSHHCFADDLRTPWLTTDWALSQLAADSDKAQQLYRNFMHDGLDDGYRKEFHRGSFEGRVLGDDNFVEQALLHAQDTFSSPVTVSAILDVVCHYYGVEIVALSSPDRHHPLSEARAVAAWLVKQSRGLQLKELGDRLSRDLSGLSQAARRIESRAMSNPKVKIILDLLKTQANKSACQA